MYEAKRTFAPRVGDPCLDLQVDNNSNVGAQLR